MTIYVTEQDIASGCAGSPTSCPIALAALRSGVQSPLVNADLIIWQDGNGTVHHQKLTKEQFDFVFDFDSGIEVNPFAFTLENE